MKQAILSGISALLISVILPGWLLFPEKPSEDNAVVLIIEQPIPKEEKTEITVLYRGEIITLPLETYLTGVVLSEMPASFHEEALKAQSVAARTFAMRQMTFGKHQDFDVCTDSSCCQAWNCQDNLEKKLGEHGAIYWDKAEQAVIQTEGEVLLYQGSLIDAVYFSCSGGSTEDAVAVWGSEVPYLQSVPSRGEEYASVFETENIIKTDRFREKMQVLFPDIDLSDDTGTWFGTVQYTDGGGVDTIEIGGVDVKGTTLRQAFGLNSTKFSVNINGDDVVFCVKGYGHRVGLSQYGANAMAEAGSDYREILLHYYTDTDIGLIK